MDDGRMSDKLFHFSSAMIHIDVTFDTAIAVENHLRERRFNMPPFPRMSNPCAVHWVMARAL